MSLAVDRLRVRAALPPRLRSLAPSVDRIARAALADGCARELAGRWPSGPAVCRIPRLYVKVQLSPRDLDEPGLKAAWAAAFSRELWSVISRPAAVADVIVAADPADWTATFLLHLLDGTAGTHWADDEFGEWRDVPLATAILGLLERTPADVPAILRAVARRDRLERLLATLGEDGCEAACILVSRRRAGEGPVTVDDLLAVGRWALDAAAGPARALGSARHALARYVAGGPVAAGSPVRMLGLLRALEWLLAIVGASPSGGDAGVIEGARARLRSDNPVEAIQRQVLSIVRQVAADGPPAARAALAGSLAALAPLVAATAPPLASTVQHSLTSDRAGALLLLGTVVRLGWPEAVRGSLLAADHGPRALTYVLAGTGLALFGRAVQNRLDDRLDPALALLAGWVGEPDPRGFARCLDETADRHRQELLARLTPGADAAASARWEDTFSHLATHVARAFAADVRGFRGASRRFVVERFLSTPGRIVVHEARVVVALAPNPFWVAVHLSGADVALDGVGWLGGRRVEFELEGL